MTYFSKFPLTPYVLNSEKTIVCDILRRSAFISEYKPYTDIYEPYTIVDGETPQMIAMRFYGAVTYHWVVLMFNEIHNPYFDWPIDQLNLEKLCIMKYGNPGLYQTKHYELGGVVVGEVKEYKSGVSWVSPTPVGNASAVSFYEYEQRLNDAKRNITILRTELLGEFVKQFGDSIDV